MGLHLLTYPEQVAEHLRSEISKGNLSNEMPGTDCLSKKLNVNRATIASAIQMLEHEGILKNRGAGRRREIVLPKETKAPVLRIGLFLYEKCENKVDFIIELKSELQSRGHSIAVPSQGLVDLRMDVDRISQVVEKTNVDCWVVQSASKDVLEWFAQQPLPAFALSGCRQNVNIAGSGPDKVPAVLSAVQHLVALGHKRIVMLAREDHRKPHPGVCQKAFLNQLKTLGISVGPYNLPDWDEAQDGFYQCLDSLFKFTPPTAVLVDDISLYLAAERHIARLGFFAPEDVSLVCPDPHPSFEWFRPQPAHINWSTQPMVNHIVKWADRVALGKNDRKQYFLKAEFIEGGTIGPAPRQACLAC